MNLKQMVILCVVLVALVFIITMATMSLGGGKPNPNSGPTPRPPPLTFPITRVEPVKGGGEDPGTPPIYELQQPGHHDFWFQNDSGAAVQLGLSKTGCSKCTSVEVCILPEDQWKGVSEDKRPGLAGGAAWQPVPEYGKDRKTLTVPPGAAGWVRVAWKGERAGPENLTATLMTQVPEGNWTGQELSVPVLFVEPVICQVDDPARDPAKAPALAASDEKHVGKLGAGESRQAVFLCWSCTRDNFDLTPQPASTPCVAADEPAPLGDKECKDLAEKLKLPVRCAYRLTVTVREQVGDKQLDLGLFRYGISLTSKVSPNPLSVYVSGEVEGSVSVVSEDERIRSRIDLGHFPRGEDKHVEIRLVTSDRNLRLELDGAKTRATPFFEVAEPVEIKQTVGKLWRVELKIPAGTVEGPFPVRDRENPKPGYDDCAVYLKIHKTGEAGPKPDEPWRRIRVPIRGNATAAR